MTSKVSTSSSPSSPAIAAAEAAAEAALLVIIDFLSRIRSATGAGRRAAAAVPPPRLPAEVGRRTRRAQAVAQDDVEEQDEQLDVDEEQVDPNTVSE